MSYHDLSSCTLNADERREEADRILRMLDDNLLTQKECEFRDRIKYGGPISVKQLFLAPRYQR